MSVATTDAARAPSPAAPVQRHRLDRTAILLLVALCALWALGQVSIKAVAADVPPVLQSALRSAGATVLLFAWCRLRGLPLFGRDGTFLPGLAAGALFGLEFLLIYWGLTFTTASRAAIFIYMAPFVVAVGAHLFLPGDRLSLGKVMGLVGAFAGMAIAFADGLRLPSHRELVGDAMCLAAAVAWGATTVLIKATRLGRASAEKTLFYQLAVSAVLLSACLPLFEGALAIRLTPAAFAVLVYQAAVVAFMSYVVWFWLMRSYPASRLAAFSFLTPVLTVAFGGLLLGEAITVGLLTSLALIAGGIYLVNRPPGASRR